MVPFFTLSCNLDGNHVAWKTYNILQLSDHCQYTVQLCIFSFKKASLKLSSNRGSPVTHHFEPLCWSLLDISSFGWEVIPLMYLPASCASSLGVISIVYHIVEKKFKSEPSHFTTPSFFPPKYHWLSVVSGNHITLNSFLCGLSAELHDPSHGSYATTLSKLQYFSNRLCYTRISPISAEVYCSSVNTNFKLEHNLKCNLSAYLHAIY